MLPSRSPNQGSPLLRTPREISQWPLPRPLLLVAVLVFTAGASFAVGVSWGSWRAQSRLGRQAALGQQPGQSQAPQQPGMHDQHSSPSQLKAAFAARIPKILHHIFIPDMRDPKSARLTMWPQHQLWVRNCKYHYESAGWEHRLWNASACEELVAQHYPDFLDFYRHNVSLANEKSDLMRYIVLHRFGGLYLDSDVDCWREGGDMLEGADVVLQGSHNGEGAGSASIASVPGAPIWMAALELVQLRNTTYDNWWISIQRTGPDLLTDAAEHVGVKRGKDKLFSKADYHVGGLVYRVYPGGSWFLPCQWWEASCRRGTYQALAIGQQDMTRTVGMHRFAGSWIAGKEDGKGIVNVTEELCHPKPDSKKRRALVAAAEPLQPLPLQDIDED